MITKHALGTQDMFYDQQTCSTSRHTHTRIALTHTKMDQEAQGWAMEHPSEKLELDPNISFHIPSINCLRLGST